MGDDYETSEAAAPQHVLMGLVFIFPMTAFLLWLGVHVLIEFLDGPRAPAYTGEPVLSREGTLWFLGVIALLFGFFARVTIQLIVTLVTGHRPARLLPWWLATGVLGAVVLIIAACSVSALIRGNWQAALGALAASAPFLPWLRDMPRLRKRQQSEP